MHDRLADGLKGSEEQEFDEKGGLVTPRQFYVGKRQ